MKWSQIFLIACVLAALITHGVLSRPAVAQTVSSRPELITDETEKSIKKGLVYLAKTQDREGAWKNQAGYGAYPCAMTALAGLALLASGSTPVEGEYSQNIRRAMDYVMKSANASGLISREAEEQQCMYGHGFSMLFLAQAYGMVRDEAYRNKIRRVLAKAVLLTGHAQSLAGGWLYTPDSGGDEGSVTVTQIQGLRAIRNAGIKVDKSIIDRAAQYIQKSANPDGGIRYQAGNQGESRPAITAAAVATLYNAGQYENPVAVKALEFIKKVLKNNRGSTAMVFSGHEYYSTLYIAQAMYLSSAENWNEFFPRCRDDLIHKQQINGSWQGDGVGEVYGTAIALITMQLPYKYLPILQR
jgi:hypothetical protein